MNRRHRYSRGLVLVNALLVVAALSAVAVLLLQTAQTSRIRQFYMQERAQTEAYLDGFELLMRRVLDQDRRDNSVDHLREPWAQKNYQVEIDRGQVIGTTRDLQGLFNLNWLAGGDGLAGAESFLQLVLARGVPEKTGQEILDWISRDGPPGKASYLARNPALAPPGGAPVMLDELRQVKGMTSGYFSRLEPVLTTIPAEGSLNINTTPRDVLQAVMPEVSAAVIGAIVAQRKIKAFETDEDLAIYLQGVLTTEEQAKFGTGFFGVSSQWFQSDFTATLGQSRAQRSVIFRRAPKTGKTQVKFRFMRKK